jgi:hypothetical protein
MNSNNVLLSDNPACYNASVDSFPLYGQEANNSMIDMLNLPNNRTDLNLLRQCVWSGCWRVKLSSLVAS